MKTFSNLDTAEAFKISRRRFGFLALGTLAVMGGVAGYAYYWQRGARPVVALIDDGVGALDVVGPMEILGRLPDARGLYTAAEAGAKKVARGPLTLHVDIRLSDLEQPDVILLPGIAGREPSATEIVWLKRVAPAARLILGVGEGQRWLAAAGLQPDNMKIVASEGGAAAIDAALTATARLAGRDYAEALQLAIEYDPAPPYANVNAGAPVIQLPTVPALRAAILLYDGMTSLDAIGPYEVLSRVPAISIDLVGKTTANITSDTGALTMSVTHSIENAKDYDVILIPGGAYGTQKMATDEGILTWIKAMSVNSRLVMSVCTGALILGKTGLLNGQHATTHWASQAALEQLGASYLHERYVRQPKLITAAGVSAGIDVALAALGDLFGVAVGAAIQAQLPYVPKPPFDMGAIGKASPEVVALSKQVLQRNAIASFIRMTAYSLLG